MLNNKGIDLPIGGFIKQSLIDYPGNISCVIFTQGCNFRCLYCHNPDLVWPKRIKESGKLDSGFIFNWINQNQQLLDAVVITGGEPTMHLSLESFIVQIKEMGLKVKLDTNGTNPNVLDKLISNNLLDYIAMDIKAPLYMEEYKTLVGPAFNQKQFNSIKSSIELIKCSSVEFEFRTTVLDKYHTAESIENIVSYLECDLYLQNYRSVQDEANKHLRPFNDLRNLVTTSNFSSFLKLRE